MQSFGGIPILISRKYRSPCPGNSGLGVVWCLIFRNRQRSGIDLNQHIPGTLESACLLQIISIGDPRAGSFGRGLYQKLPNLFVENTRQNPGYGCHPFVSLTVRTGDPGQAGILFNPGCVFVRSQFLYHTYPANLPVDRQPSPPGEQMTARGLVGT